MLTAEQIRTKIYKLAEDFEEMYRAKQYAQAKYIYESASMMAVFMELPQEDMHELFMNHNDDEDAPPVWGRFNMTAVRRCFSECIRANKTYELEAFHKPRAPRSRYDKELPREGTA